MKRKVKITIKIISFVLVFTLLLGCVNSLFKPKWLEDRWQSSKTDVSFYELEKTVPMFCFMAPVLWQRQSIHFSYTMNMEFLPIIWE